MHHELRPLVDGLNLTGNIAGDAVLFLLHHGCPRTAQHSAEVAAVASNIAERFNLTPDKAEIAGWLHDISAVFPADDRANIAHRMGIPVLPEEERFPMLIHQKLSAIISYQIFGVRDRDILSAISCHTTLKRAASDFDKAVFVADKIAWDRHDQPPYLSAIHNALRDSLDAAALVYLQYIWDQRDTLREIHPWLRDAYTQLAQPFEK